MVMENESKFTFVGNHTVLDFINTLLKNQNGPVELLLNFPDILNWMTEAKVISPSKRTELLITWRDERENTQVVEKVRAFRKILHAMVTELIDDRAVSQNILDEINYTLAYSTSHFQIAHGKKGLTKERVHGFKSAMHFLVPFAEMAVNLLTETDHKLIRKCENPECVIVFYDTSKNHTRRWCRMQVCGNRFKAAKFYKRNRK